LRGHLLCTFLSITWSEMHSNILIFPLGLWRKGV